MCDMTLREYRQSYINYLFFILWVCLVVSKCVVGSQDSLNKDTNSPNTPDLSQNEVNSGESEHVLFTPTNEWQDVKPYHTLPRGLHIRMNLQTGKKEAKLLDKENSQSDEMDTSALTVAESENENEEDLNLSQGQEGSSSKKDSFTREEISEALKLIKNEDTETQNEDVSTKKKSKFRSYEEIKTEFESLQMKIETDGQILRRLLDSFANSDNERKILILEDLEYYLHQVDNAVDFVQMGGFQKVIDVALNCSSSDVRQGALLVVGAASQNNPKVQIAVLEKGLFNSILRTVATEKNVTVSTRAVYAISCVVRNFPYGQQKLLESGVFDIFKHFFERKDSLSLKLQLKIVKLIEDLLMERSHAQGEREKQLEEVDLIQSLVDGGWCSTVPSLLSATSLRGQDEDESLVRGNGTIYRPDHDVVQRVVGTMTLLSSSCDPHFGSQIPLLWTLKQTYADLALKEKDHKDDDDDFSFFGDFESQIETLLIKIQAKDEL